MNRRVKSASVAVCWFERDVRLIGFQTYFICMIAGLSKVFFLLNVNDFVDVLCHNANESQGCLRLHVNEF